MLNGIDSTANPYFYHSDVDRSIRQKQQQQTTNNKVTYMRRRSRCVRIRAT
jgi:hypothetical protein